jgi:hypothetical protein
MNFYHHTVTWDTDTIPMKNRDTCNLSSVEALIEAYMIGNEPQTLRDEYSRAIKILDAEYKQTSASLDDVIKTCENLHVEEQHQLKALLQMIDPNCKPIHAHDYTIPRSVEQQLQQSKEIVRLVNNCNKARRWTLESLKKSIPLNGLLWYHHLQFLRKTEQ